MGDLKYYNGTALEDKAVSPDGSVPMQDLTVGIRNGAIGVNSTTEGEYTTAEGKDSHAEGLYSKAFLRASHAEGEWTTACHGNFYIITSYNNTTKTITLDNVDELAVGDMLMITVNNVYEAPITAINGLTVTLNTTNGVNAYYAIKKQPYPNGERTTHAEGKWTFATGGVSHAQNEGTIAKGWGQTVIGRYNIPQGVANDLSEQDYAFIIGNGYADDIRSNAMHVTWGGNLKTAGDIEDGIGNKLSQKASFKTGTDTFTSGGQIYTVTDAFITVNSMVTVNPTSDKIGYWIVDSYDGYFTITSDAIETVNVTFDWGAIK